MALILHAAQDGPVTLNGCAALLDALFARAGEPPALTGAERRDLLADRLRELEVARLLERGDDGAWHLTGRGQSALRDHPEGVDWSVLTGYPEFAEHLRARTPQPAGMDPRAASYDQGFVARLQGEPFTANPYPPSTADHLSWENGWMQALDRGAQ
jgi:hypothetical protein